jgi:hypothetical protein
MASIPLPVVTAPDQFSMRIEDALETILASCQSGDSGTMKVSLTLLNAALVQWTTALAIQIAAL